MKSIVRALVLMSGLAHVQAKPPSTLEVHEWGTFTILCSPGRDHRAWYTPESDLVHLPAFVHPGFFGKGAVPQRIRMETPVIYFYPQQEMKVAVDVHFEEGTITETYPYGSLQFAGPSASNPMMRFKASWTGTLRPPGDARAQGLIPVIPPSTHQEPYGAAREVPEAWIFESDVKQVPREAKPLAQPEADKFIFYRGAGNATLPVSASISSAEVSVMHSPIRALRHAVVLRVRGDRAGWVTLELPAGDDPQNEPTTTSAAVPVADRPLDEVEAEMAADWKQALAARGLTADEASAMVETWRKTWFREEGDRVLTLMPREEIDRMLPLTIAPAPTTLERVFVARLEMIAPERALALANLLDGAQFGAFRWQLPMVSSAPREVSDATGGSLDLLTLEALNFGRFEQGAIEIAVEQRTQELRQAYQQLVFRRAQAQQVRAQSVETKP